MGNSCADTVPIDTNGPYQAVSPPPGRTAGRCVCNGAARALGTPALPSAEARILRAALYAAHAQLLCQPFTDLIHHLLQRHPHCAPR